MPPNCGRSSTNEETFDLARISAAEHDDHLARAGRNTEWYRDTTPGARPKPFRPIVGSGMGGSSALYGMVTERFFREDFEPRANFRDVGDSTVPESWPVKYEEMVPWYRKAEQLYRVRGAADPLRPGDDTDSLLRPAPMTASNSEVAAFLTERGMHPYGLHVACEYTDECKACQAYLCAAGCKNHAGNICVEPALRDHGAVVLDRTTVVRLESTRTRITGVVARHSGQTLRFTGKVVVLAASALQTPVILLNSGSKDWPNGLANDNEALAEYVRENVAVAERLALERERRKPHDRHHDRREQRSASIEGGNVPVFRTNSLIACLYSLPRSISVSSFCRCASNTATGISRSKPLVLARCNTASSSGVSASR